VLSTIGHSDVMKITQIAARGASRKTTSQIGNHASGDTGRSSCTIGLAACQTRRLAPMASPSGMPTAAARTKPLNTRCSDPSSSRPTPRSLGPLLLNGEDSSSRRPSSVSAGVGS
jgi:hypothetical protein